MLRCSKNRDKQEEQRDGSNIQSRYDKRFFEVVERQHLSQLRPLGDQSEIRAVSPAGTSPSHSLRGLKADPSLNPSSHHETKFTSFMPLPVHSKHTHTHTYTAQHARQTHNNTTQQVKYLGALSCAQGSKETHSTFTAQSNTEQTCCAIYAHLYRKSSCVWGLNAQMYYIQ